MPEIHKCFRCSQMKATRDNPSTETGQCGVCGNYYCAKCHAAHCRGKCYICEKRGGACYVQGIGECVCWECL